MKSIAWLLGTAAIAAALLLATLAKADEPGQKIAAGVQSWWIMDGGRRIVFLDANGFHTWEEAGGKTTLLHACRVAGWILPISDTLLCAQEQEGRVILLDVKAGRAKAVLSGAERYELYGVQEGRDWFVAMAERGEDNSGREFFRVGLDGNAQRVYETPDTGDIFDAAVSADGKTLKILIEGEDPNRMVLHAVDLATGKAKTKTAARDEAVWERDDANYALAGGKGEVVLSGGRLRVVSGGKEADLFPPGGRCWAIANRAKDPTQLALLRLTDTNGDGRVAREDGDRVEIWMLDLRTGRPTLLADANCENIERDWSPDGQSFAWSRWREAGVCDLELYNLAGGKTTVFPSPGKDRVWMLEAFLADARLLVVQVDLTESAPSGDAPAKPHPAEVLLLDPAAPRAAPVRLARGTNPEVQASARAVYVELTEKGPQPEAGSEASPWSRSSGTLYHLAIPARKAVPASATAP